MTILSGSHDVITLFISCRIIAYEVVGGEDWHDNDGPRTRYSDDPNSRSPLWKNFAA